MDLLIFNKWMHPVNLFEYLNNSLALGSGGGMIGQIYGAKDIIGTPEIYLTSAGNKNLGCTKDMKTVPFTCYLPIAQSISGYSFFFAGETTLEAK